MKIPRFNNSIFLYLKEINFTANQGPYNGFDNMKPNEPISRNWYEAWVRGRLNVALSAMNGDEYSMDIIYKSIQGK